MAVMVTKINEAANAHRSTCGVYALVDPRTDETMYVGRSVDIGRRFKAHLDPYRYEPNVAKRRWLNALSECGLIPRLVVLETCDDEESSAEAEKRLIREFKSKGQAALNITEGGFSRTVSPTLNSKQEEWLEFGRKAKECRALLMEVSADAQRLAGPKYARSWNDLVIRLDGAKSVLDGVVCRVFPEWVDAIRVFYGEQGPR